LVQLVKALKIQESVRHTARELHDDFRICCMILLSTDLRDGTIGRSMICGFRNAEMFGVRFPWSVSVAEKHTVFLTTKITTNTKKYNK
jgi:hypothetical protein